MPMSHPLYPYDDIRNNPGFSWQLDLSTLPKKYYLEPLIVHDDDNDPTDYRLLLSIRHIDETDLKQITECLWAFCNNPKKLPYKIKQPHGIAPPLFQTPDNPIYKEYENKIVAFDMNTVFIIPHLEESFQPGVLCNIVASKKCSRTNGMTFCKLTPDLWEAIRQKKYKLVIVHPDMSTSFNRYSNATYEHAQAS